jgi:hypothetical protein
MAPWRGNMKIPDMNRAAEVTPLKHSLTGTSPKNIHHHSNGHETKWVSKSLTYGPNEIKQTIRKINQRCNWKVMIIRSTFYV